MCGRELILAQTKHFYLKKITTKLCIYANTETQSIPSLRRKTHPKMASSIKFAVLLAGALLLSLADVAKAQDALFVVEGEVYCEVCRINFINKLSVPMAGTLHLLLSCFS